MVYFHKERRKTKMHPSLDRCIIIKSFTPIVQALAPCLLVGCCVVIRLAPSHTLYGCNHYITESGICQPPISILSCILRFYIRLLLMLV